MREYKKKQKKIFSCVINGILCGSFFLKKIRDTGIFKEKKSFYEFNSILF